MLTKRVGKDTTLDIPLFFGRLSLANRIFELKATFFLFTNISIHPYKSLDLYFSRLFHCCKYSFDCFRRFCWLIFSSLVLACVLRVALFWVREVHLTPWFTNMALYNCQWASWNCFSWTFMALVSFVYINLYLSKEYLYKINPLISKLRLDPPFCYFWNQMF